jgi:hypothetical protein
MWLTLSPTVVSNWSKWYSNLWRKIWVCWCGQLQKGLFGDSIVQSVHNFNKMPNEFSRGAPYSDGDVQSESDRLRWRFSSEGFRTNGMRTVRVWRPVGGRYPRLTLETQIEMVVKDLLASLCLWHITEVHKSIQNLNWGIVQYFS